MLPVSLPLQSTSDNPSADGITYPADILDVDGLNAYYLDITDLLYAANHDPFQPGLTLLDELISSITILEN